MHTDVERLSPTSVRLTVEVPFEELRPSLDAAYKEIARQVNVPGFRRGKVPPPVIDQRLGRGVVLEEAVNRALPELYRRSLLEHGLEPLGQPEIDLTDLADGERLTFTAEVDVRPDLTLPDVDGLEVEVEPVHVSDADVEQQVQALRERFATLLEVDREARDGDVVTIDLAAAGEEGEPIEDAQVSGLSYRVGEGSLVDGVDEALRGMTAGESRTFSTTLVGGERAGAAVEVAVTVHAVKEQQLPEVDDEFAQTASEFDSVEELTRDLRERLERARRLEQAAAARDAVLAKVLEQVDVPLPERVVREEVQSRRQHIGEQLSQAGVSEQQYLVSEQQSEEEFAGSLEQRAREALTAQFVLDEVAKAEQLGVEEAELADHIVRRAQRAGVRPEAFAQEVAQAGHVPLLVSEVVRGKALARLVEKAHVRDTSGAPIDLEHLRPDGTYGETSAEAADPEPAERADRSSTPA